MDVGPEDIIRLLDLKPLPVEGGYYRETYRSGRKVPGGDRDLSTAIYYLLTPDTFSAIHRLSADELYHYYMGDPVEMLLLLPDGRGRRVILGCDLARGELPQVLVPAGCWQGSRLLPGGRLALMGTTMSPGFELGEYEHGSRSDLLESYPGWAELIRGLSSPSQGSGTEGGAEGTEGTASS